MSLFGIPVRRFAAAALAVALFAGGAREAGAQKRRNSRDETTRVDTTVAIARNGTLTVVAGNGDVTVAGWSRDQAHVRGETEGGDVRVETSGGGSRMTVSVGGRSGDSQLEISVPVGVRVIVQSRSGDVSVRGTRGQVEVRCGSTRALGSRTWDGGIALPTCRRRRD